MVAAAVAGLDVGHVAAALRDGQSVSISVGGSEHQLEADDCDQHEPLEGYQLEREARTPWRWRSRSTSHARRRLGAGHRPRRAEARQDAGLQISDRIVLTLDGDEELVAAPDPRGYVAGETLAISVSYESLDGAEPVMIDGRPLKIGVRGTGTGRRTRLLVAGAPGR